MCVCASISPGRTVAPPTSSTTESAIANDSISRREPTAAIRSPAMATASATANEGSQVTNRPLTRRRSILIAAGMLALPMFVGEDRGIDDARHREAEFGGQCPRPVLLDGEQALRRLRVVAPAGNRVRLPVVRRAAVDEIHGRARGHDR